MRCSTNMKIVSRIIVKNPIYQNSSSSIQICQSPILKSSLNLKCRRNMIITRTENLPESFENLRHLMLMIFSQLHSKSNIFFSVINSHLKYLIQIFKETSSQSTSLEGLEKILLLKKQLFTIKQQALSHLPSIMNLSTSCQCSREQKRSYLKQ